MKIKTWLLIAFLIVMILPLASAYYLFASTLNFQETEKVEEYYDAYEQIQEMEPMLHNKALYDPLTSKKELEQWTDEQVGINLYNKDGYILYSSNHQTRQPVIKKDKLYRDLFELQQSLNMYTYKEPVLDKGNIIGFYEVTIAREAFTEKVTDRGLIITTVFIASFILIYAVIAFLVHKRINQRLTRLMNEMSAFAAGENVPESKTGNDEIGELQSRFYDMRTQIEEAQALVHKEQEDKEYTVATISHDLKTPLTSIKAYAEALEEEQELSRRERTQYRNIIIEKSDFMKQMLDDLLIHTLLQSKTYELDVVTVDGEEFFDMLLSGYEALTEAKDQVLTVENSVTSDVKISPKQMMRVTDNLMSNAIHHTPAHGKIWLGAFSDEVNIPSWIFDYVQRSYTFDTEQYVYLVVQNEGDGIEKENRDALFDPLYQVDQARSTQTAHGTGLGLSISQIIIEKHEGTIAVRSEVDRGACFICAIPKKEEG